MSFMKGDLISKTRKLVKGLAMAEPIWLKAMEQSPPATFPRAAGKIPTITFPEDVYVKKFYKKYPDSKYHDAIKKGAMLALNMIPRIAVRISAFDPPPSRIYGLRVLELKEQGVSEEQALAVADMEYLAEKKAKKKAYARLKQIARLEGKRLPPNPYPSPVKEIQAEERAYVRRRFHDPKMLEIIERQKAEAKERFGRSDW
ncbi:hypothetical protein Lal_00049427 [Lupinus albus]|nr:hypothetical protein Lal_00049427 [Lupinus albus]